MSSQPADSLFTPTLDRGYRVERPEGERPWRVSSQFYVAFFGGVLALSVIAYRNADRLGMTLAAKRRIAVTGGLVTLATIGTLAYLLAWPPSQLSGWLTGPDSRRWIRLINRAAALILFLVFAAWQKSADRRYAAFGSGEYDSLWKAGIITVLVSDLLVIALLAPIVSALR